MSDTSISDSSVQVEALKPCPFCGYEFSADLIDSLYPNGTYWVMDARGYKHYVSHKDRGNHPNPQHCWNVVCGSCSAEVNSDTRDEAIAAWNRRAAMPVAPSDAEILRKVAEAQEKLLVAYDDATPAEFAAEQLRFDNTLRALLAARALPVAALSDADRELMQQAAEALDLILDESVGDGTVRHRISAEMAYAAEQVIAALRTRLLRHSEGKE